MIWSAAQSGGLSGVADAARSAQSSLTAQAAFWTKLVDGGGDIVVNLAVAALILVLTVWASGWAARLVRAALGRLHPRRGPADPTLQIFAASVARNVVLIVGLVAVLQQLGVRTTSIIAVLGAASLAIGLALQGALSNVAAGVMILLFRPYRVGDIIESGGRTGRVRALDLFVTELSTLDNLKIVLPNSKVFGDVIINHSFHDKRRADVVFRLPLGADTAQVMAGLLRRLKADPRVLDEPAPLVETTLISEVFVEIAVRPWTSREDYARVKADVLYCARQLERDPGAPLPPLPSAPSRASDPPQERRPRGASDARYRPARGQA